MKEEAYIRPGDISGPSQIDPADDSMRLSVHDEQFIQYIISEITEDGKLPFSIPPQSIPRIIKNSALWFYRECADSVISKWYGIRRDEIMKSRDEDEFRNATIVLPPNIEAVTQLYCIKNTGGFGALARFMREPIVYAGAMNALGSAGIGQYGLTNPYRMANRDSAFEESFARMYEYSLQKTLLTKGVMHEYNAFTHELVILGEISTDAAIETLVRIPLTALYNDYRFREHVVASCMVRLKKILSTFGYSYPGEITIDFDSMEKLGSERKKELEELITKESISEAGTIILKR